MKLLFTPTAWDEYLWYQSNDRPLLKRVNQLLADITRNGNEGIGKPEPLRGELAGFWSRRVDQKNHLVYKIENDTVIVIACRSHYGDR